MGTTTKKQMLQLLAKLHELQANKPAEMTVQITFNDRYIMAVASVNSDVLKVENINLNIYNFLAYKENQRELNGFIIAMEELSERLSSIHRIA